MTVAELMAELERVPRGATVRALVVGPNLVAGAADVERVHVAAMNSVDECVPQDVVVVACVKTIPAKKPIVSR